MTDIMKLLLSLSVVMLAGGASCVRGPDDGEGPTSEGPRNANVEGARPTGTDESANGTTGLPTPREAPVVAKVDHPVAKDGFVRAARPREIDINSGDVRGTRYCTDGSSHYGIYESELSKEIRRLGMAIAEQRDWRPLTGASGGSGGMYIDSGYANFLPTARKLLEELDKAGATDDKRRDVLERLMTSLRTERPLTVTETGRLLIDEIRAVDK